MHRHLLVSDLDGTLLNEYGNVTDATVEAVRALRDAGHYFTVATGRSPMMTKPILEKLEIDLPVITYNGACLYDPRSDRPIFTRTYSSESSKELLHYLREKEYHFHVLADGAFHVDEGTITRYEWYRSNKDFHIHVLSPASPLHSIAKTTVMVEEKELLPVWNELVQAFPRWSIYASSPQTIDIHAANTSKGRTLEHLTRELKVPMKQTITFGNYYNDIDMLQVADLGIAVKNAPPAVKVEADLLIDSHENNAVANFMNLYFKLPQAT
ncbi:HAD family phosphatase [Paenalkalicoccus suaedae]|uniref:HAD family phosphatase n=1 Tax=Paenalkalicoccus suaedae TaxID=2592382 RepID=A0A859FIF1_9BACI|nr:Cof-type HAD-IIB family hydrolase [Paenalkalicoccus suaedae]QKS72494.1 HAD family phosphatase [Paenalkalicoccus suaedae]